MNKKALEGLNKEEEIMNEIKDARLEVNDLERELEWMYSRESDEFKYIAHLEGRVRELLAKIERLDENN
jgi:hypothetical protein